MQQDDTWEEDFELEELLDDISSEREKLPFIKFKDHIDEGKDNQRFLIFFSLFCAIIGAIIVVAIPVELLFPTTSGIWDLDISSKLPLLQSVAGAVIGAFIGSVVGFVLDLFLNAYRLNKKDGNEEFNLH